MNNSTAPTSDQAQPIVIIRTEDAKVAGTTHRHSGCEKCLAVEPHEFAISPEMDDEWDA